MTTFWILVLVCAVALPIQWERNRRRWERNNMNAAQRVELRRAEKALEDANARAAGSRAAAAINQRLGIRNNH